VSSIFICDMCHGTFEGREREEADTDAMMLWGVPNASARDDMITVCDECFERIHPDKFPEIAAEVRDQIEALNKKTEN
jgi:hypothetical protein